MHKPKTFLVTGARAPMALEMVRRLAVGGNRVFVADSFRNTIARFSNAADRSFLVPAPSRDPKAYIAAIANICREHAVDLVVPTCEEVYYLAWGKAEIERYAPVFCETLENIRRVHSKFDLTTMVHDFAVRSPETILLRSAEDVARLRGESRDYVFKPVFSRFGVDALIRPRPEQLTGLDVSPEREWVAQRFIEGIELCSYSVSFKGEVRAHVCYRSIYKAGQSSGTYFQPVANAAIASFVAEFCKRYGFHGQIGFDFIVAPSGEVFVIEANPRTTNGVHLTDSSFGPRQFESEAPLLAQSMEKPRMVSYAMLLYHGVRAMLKGEVAPFLRDYRQAKDVVFELGDWRPFIGQFLCFGEIITRAVRARIPILKATTCDIEWNGGPIG